MNELHPYILLIGSIIVSALISFLAVGRTIHITQKRKIYDTPDDIRKFHGAEIPSMGGIGIFLGFLVVGAALHFGNYYFVFISSAILFFTGVYDDLKNMSPLKKLAAQLLASFITIYFLFSDPHFVDGFHGLEFSQVPISWTSIVFYTLFCTFFINAFNFIDGIDALACLLAIGSTCVLAVFYSLLGYATETYLLLSLAGGTAGLLYYNRAPARIYMGDTGSMLLGFNMFVFSIIFLSKFESTSPTQLTPFVPERLNASMLLLSILFLPMYDAVRVFVLRLAQGKSPLRADRLHLHYYLLDAGFSHTKAALTIMGIFVLIVGSVYLLQSFNPIISIIGMLSISQVSVFIIHKIRQRNGGKQALQIGK